MSIYCKPAGDRPALFAEILAQERDRRDTLAVLGRLSEWKRDQDRRLIDAPLRPRAAGRVVERASVEGGDWRPPSRIAEEFGISLHDLYEAAHAGELEAATDASGAALFDREAVIAWLQERNAAVAARSAEVRSFRGHEAMFAALGRRS